MTDTQRLQTILTDFQKRMRKNGVTNKAIWAAFTSLPSISPVQFTRRLNSYGITVTNREVSSLWKYVGIKTNSMNYEDFVKVMQASPSSLQPSTKPTKQRSPTHQSPDCGYDQEAEDDYSQRGGTAYAVARPRLGRKEDDQPAKKERIGSRPSTAANSKPHVRIDSRFMNPKKPSNIAKIPKVSQKYNVPEELDEDLEDEDGYGENLYNGAPNPKEIYKTKQSPDDIDDEMDNYEDNEGSVASSSKYSRGRGSVNYDDEDLEGSVASSSKYNRGRESANYDDEELEGSVASSSKYSRGKGSVNYDDEDDADYSSYKSGKGSSRQDQKNPPKKVKFSPKRVNNSGIDDEILNQGTYDSADDNEDNYYEPSRKPQYANEDDFDDDEDASQYSRRQPSQRSNSAYNDDDDIGSNKNYKDDDDDDFEDKRFSKNGSARSGSKKNQEPELFSRIPSSNSPNSPNRNPPSGGRRNLDPMIFGSRNVSSAAKSSRSSAPTDDQEAGVFKGAERVSGISLKKLVTLISEHVYQNYPNGKSCFHKWRGIHSGIEAEDLRNGLARDSKILISSDDADKIISKYGGPLTLSTFSRMLSDGTRFAEEEKSGHQELTNDEEAILKIAHSVKGNKWEDMIYRAPDVVDIVNGFADMGIKVNEDDIRVLTQKIGKTGLVNAIRANM